MNMKAPLTILLVAGWVAYLGYLIHKLDVELL